jgi:malonyl-CoA O-methyltransferase
MDIQIPSKNLIAKTFSRKAARYCETAFIQRNIIQRLVRLMKADNLSEYPWLDAGSGVGLLGSVLKEKNAAINLFNADFALGPLKKLREVRKSPVIQSDIEAMPFKTSSFGAVVVSSVFQWIATIEKAVSEINRVLIPGGVLYFSVFLEGSFSQLFSLRRKRNLTIPVRLFGLDGFSKVIQNAGFEEIKSETIHEEYYFPTGREAIKFMSEVGSSAVSGERLSRRELLALFQDYEDTYSTALGVPFTINAALGTARKGK